MTEITQPQGQGFWKGDFASWKESGLTQQAYCAREGISYQSFVYQHHRTTGRPKKSGLEFIEATFKSADKPCGFLGLEVMLPNGVRIGFTSEATSTLVQTILGMVGSI